MLDTHRLICDMFMESSGVDLWSAKDATRIAQIANQPFDYNRHPWLPGAEDVLSALLARGVKLCLLTSYDEEIWPERAKFLRMDRFFDPESVLAIPGKKTPADFLHVSKIGDDPDVAAFAIGNRGTDLCAVRDDSRWRGLLIPVPSTVPDQDEIELADHPRVTVLKSISEVLNHIPASV